jgi:hypothetical protein
MSATRRKVVRKVRGARSEALPAGQILAHHTVATRDELDEEDDGFL